MNQPVDYYFKQASSLRSWSELGDIPRSRLDNLEVGICVELVLMSSVQESGKNVQILEFITPEYMKGMVNDDNLSSGAHCRCNICGEYSAPEELGEESDLYCCGNGNLDNNCNFSCS